MAFFPKDKFINCKVLLSIQDLYSSYILFFYFKECNERSASWYDWRIKDIDWVINYFFDRVEVDFNKDIDIFCKTIDDFRESWIYCGKVVDGFDNWC